MAHTEDKPLLKANAYSDDISNNACHDSFDIDDRQSKPQPTKRKYPPLRWCIYGGLLQLILILVYSTVSLYVIRISSQHCDIGNTDPMSDLAASAPDIHAFAGLVVRYKFRLYDNFINSPYTGAPTPESDLAWHNLLNNMSVRVTAEELAAHNQTSVRLPSGGYLAWLGVFHELHCVKVLRQWSRRDHYFPQWATGEMTAHEKAHQMVHIDHCIDWLRNAAICRADTSALAVFKWDKRLAHPMLNTKRVNHRCVDWDALMGSSHADRLVSREEVASLKNPLMENSE